MEKGKILVIGRDLEGPLLGYYPGFKTQMMEGLKTSLRSGYFEVESRRTCRFLEEKSRDEVRPDIFGATAPRRMRFSENFQL
jgi:hypothetical protein